jgi:hypothetical protein
MTTGNFPSSLSKVPLTWLYLDQVFEMEMLAGFACYSQDKDTRAVRPKIGWAVRDVGVVPVARKGGGRKQPRKEWFHMLQAARTCRRCPQSQPS